MGIQVVSTSWERRRPGQSSTVGVVLVGAGKEQVLLLGVFIAMIRFLLLEKGFCMNIAPEMLVIQEVPEYFWGRSTSASLVDTKILVNGQIMYLSDISVT